MAALLPPHVVHIHNSNVKQTVPIDLWPDFTAIISSCTWRCEQARTDSEHLKRHYGEDNVLLRHAPAIPCALKGISWSRATEQLVPEQRHTRKHRGGGG